MRTIISALGGFGIPIIVIAAVVGLYSISTQAVMFQVVDEDLYRQLNENVRDIPDQMILIPDYKYDERESL